MTTGQVFLNDVGVPSIIGEVQGDSSKKAIVFGGGQINLAEDDYIDLRFKSEDNDDIEVFFVSVKVRRISY